MENLILTLESRILNTDAYPILNEFGTMQNNMIRRIYNMLVSGTAESSDIQRKFHREYGISVRIIKSAWKAASALYSARKESIGKQVKLLKHRIKKYDSKIKSKIKKLDLSDPKNRLAIHNMRFRLSALKDRLQSLKTNPNFALTFGGRKFFTEQWTNDKYKKDHNLWLSEWRRKRNHSLYFVGTSKEKCQNLMCQLRDLQTVAIKLPFKFKQEFLNLKVNFNYSKSSEGKAKHYAFLLEAIENKSPLTYKIFERENGVYYIQVTFSLKKEVYYSQYGTIGVDFNYDLVATSEIDSHGNPINFKNYIYHSEGSKSGLISDQLSSVCDRIVNQAVSTKKNVVIEDLALDNKKAESRDRVTNRKINLMAYRKLRSLLLNKCLKRGVRLRIVNPAYTSVIANWKYKKRFGVSIHSAASYVIARRGFGFKDKIPFGIDCILRSGEAISWTTKRCKHYWSKWNFINKNLEKCLRKLKSAEDARGFLLDHTCSRFNLPSLRLVGSQ